MSNRRYRQSDPDLEWTGERQVGRKLDDIRPDHVARYRFAAECLTQLRTASRDKARVLDAGCGVGYGTRILADHVSEAHGVDASTQSIEFARKHWSAGNVHYDIADLASAATWADVWDGQQYDAVVALEFLEHVHDLDALLSLFRAASHIGSLLIGSTPNESVRPYSQSKFPYHFRHYTVRQIADHLRKAGFIPTAFHRQDVNPPDVHPNDEVGGQFILFMAVRSS